MLRGEKRSDIEITPYLILPFQQVKVMCQIESYAEFKCDQDTFKFDHAIWVNCMFQAQY